MAVQLGVAIKTQPVQAQVGAIERAFIFASGLEIQQRLQPGSAQRLVAAMKTRFPATRTILTREIPH